MLSIPTRQMRSPNDEDAFRMGGSPNWSQLCESFCVVSLCRRKERQCCCGCGSETADATDHGVSFFQRVGVVLL